mgnify:CR=1 FL=1
MASRIGVPKETAEGEKRVATVPDVVAKLIKLGFTVAVQSGAGEAANFADDTYRAAGAEVVATAAELWAGSDIVFKVRPPSADEVALMRDGGMLVGHCRAPLVPIWGGPDLTGDVGCAGSQARRRARRSLTEPSAISANPAAECPTR